MSTKKLCDPDANVVERNALGFLANHTLSVQMSEADLILTNEAGEWMKLRRYVEPVINTAIDLQGSWRVDALFTKNSTVALPEGWSLSFEGTQVLGQMCNSMSGPVQYSAHTLRADQLATTMMSCGDESDRAERHIGGILSHATVQILHPGSDKSSLRITGDNGDMMYVSAMSGVILD